MNRSIYKRILRTARAGVLALAVTACATANDSKRLAQASSKSGSLLAASETLPELSPSDYLRAAPVNLIAIGDVIDVSEYSLPELSGTYVLTEPGTIELPFVGKVKALGRTAQGLETYLETLYRKEYLQNPNFTVTVEKALLGNIVVDGAVEKPGVFELTTPINVSEAIALAGGLNEIASKDGIFLIRYVNGQRKVKQLNLNEVRFAAASDPIVYPTDIIIIADSNARMTYNDIVKAIPILNLAVLAATR